MASQAPRDREDPIPTPDPLRRHRSTMAARNGETLGTAPPRIWQSIRHRSGRYPGHGLVQLLPHRHHHRQRGCGDPRSVRGLPRVGHRITPPTPHVIDLHHLPARIPRHLPPTRLATGHSATPPSGNASFAGNTTSVSTTRPANPSPSPLTNFVTPSGPASSTTASPNTSFNDSSATPAPK